MITVTVCTFKRTKKSLEENGLMINEDKLIIDASGEVVEAPVWTHNAMPYRGHIKFNILRHHPDSDKFEEQKPKKVKPRRYAVIENYKNKSMSLTQLLDATDFTDSEVNKIINLEVDEYIIFDKKMTVIRKR